MVIGVVTDDEVRAALLDTAQELSEYPERWCQHELVTDRRGYPVRMDDHYRPGELPAALARAVAGGGERWFRRHMSRERQYSLMGVFSSRPSAKTNTCSS